MDAKNVRIAGLIEGSLRKIKVGAGGWANDWAATGSNHKKTRCINNCNAQLPRGVGDAALLLFLACAA